LNQNSYRKLVSGQTRGLLPTLIRFVLLLASALYVLLINIRNLLYSIGWLKTHHVPIAVISVGNITAGGTGKTPLTIWLAKFCRQKHLRCAILTRGYKADTKQLTDEPAELAEACPDTPVIVNPDRAAGAAEAISSCRPDLLILDDGFQHRRLHRNLDIVTINATCPFGYGRVLPAGLLREPLRSLKRASAIVITHCDRVDKTTLEQIKQKLVRINPHAPIAETIHAPCHIISYDNSELPLERLQNKNILAFCGIGNPSVFFQTLRSLGCHLIGTEIFDDHHRYSQTDIRRLCDQAHRHNADWILTTRKDWTKTAELLHRHYRGPAGYLVIELKFLSGLEQLTALIDATIAGKIH